MKHRRGCALPAPFGGRRRKHGGMYLNRKRDLSLVTPSASNKQGGFIGPLLGGLFSGVLPTLLGKLIPGRGEGRKRRGKALPAPFGGRRRRVKKIPKMPILGKGVKGGKRKLNAGLRKWLMEHGRIKKGSGSQPYYG